MAAIWTWFLSSKLGHWLLALGAVLLAIGAAFVGGFEKGRYSEAKASADQRAKDAIEAAKAAQATRQAARDAAAKVKADAAKQPPPDVEKRDDLDNDF